MKRSLSRGATPHGLDVALLRLAQRDHLDRTARRLHGGEALHLQHRLEHRVGFLDRDLRGRDDGDAAANAIVVDEVLAGEAGDRVDHHRQLDVIEVELHHFIGGRCAGRLGPRRVREHQAQGKEPCGPGDPRSHRFSRSRTARGSQGWDCEKVLVKGRPSPL
jgi:hypothetical protein